MHTGAPHYTRALTLQQCNDQGTHTKLLTLEHQSTNTTVLNSLEHSHECILAKHAHAITHTTALILEHAHWSITLILEHPYSSTHYSIQITRALTLNYSYSSTRAITLQHSRQSTHTGASHSHSSTHTTALKSLEHSDSALSLDYPHYSTHARARTLEHHIHICIHMYVNIYIYVCVYVYIASHDTRLLTL